MNRDTFTATIRAFKAREPFKPFTVATVSGGRHEVDSPDTLAVRDGVAVYLGPGRVPVFFDHEAVCAVVGSPTGRGGL